MSDHGSALNAENVLQFLQSHPEFFQDHPDLLADISVPHHTGGAVSLIERQVAVLRERNVELRNRLTKLLDVARENDQLFDSTRRLLLRLLESTSVEEVAANLFETLRRDFGSEIISLILFDLPDQQLKAVREMRLNDAMARIPALMKGQRAVCGLLRLDELDFLFLDDAARVGSAAVIPLLQAGRQVGLLAIGAAGREHFRSSMDTLFISHIGDVLARVLAYHLDLRLAESRVS